MEESSPILWLAFRKIYLLSAGAELVFGETLESLFDVLTATSPGDLATGFA